MTQNPAAQAVVDGLMTAIDGLTDEEALEALGEGLAAFAKYHPLGKEPVTAVRWVPADDVVRNDYNPNRVFGEEMSLLHTSIKADGYTQPIVVFRDEERGKWVVVDGFHRSEVGKTRADIRERCLGHLPVVVIDKPLADRMASTVRHNRARGTHSVAGMSTLVFSMLEAGVAETKICEQIGCSPEELKRLKVTTGFAKLFKDHEYSTAWKTRRMIQLEKEEKEKGEGKAPKRPQKARVKAAKANKAPKAPKR